MRVAVLCAALFLAGCASLTPRPGTGDLTFRLTWDGTADLDVYVLSPLEERVDFLRKEVPSGGTLDIDCNVANLVCPAPMENIFWPWGRAPTGTYHYWVVIADATGLREEDTFRLRVLLEGELLRERTGSVADLRTEPVSERLRLE